MTGWDINPRALGIVPKSYKVGAFKGMTWVNDTQFLMVPKGLSAEKLAVVLDLMKFLLQPEQQALTYDKGYFYPGPAVKNVPVSMAPQASQDVLRNTDGRNTKRGLHRIRRRSRLTQNRWLKRSAAGTRKSAHRKRNSRAK